MARPRSPLAITVDASAAQGQGAGLIVHEDLSAEANPGSARK